MAGRNRVGGSVIIRHPIDFGRDRSSFDAGHGADSDEGARL
jgi:hypothetical protein